MRRWLPITLLLALTCACVSYCCAGPRVSEPLMRQVAHGAWQGSAAACSRATGDGSVRLAIDAGTRVRSLTTEQKVAQLFFVTPESLVAGRYEGAVSAAGETTRDALRERPVGGIVYFRQNLLNTEQTREMLARTQDYALEACGIPLLLSVDEEGGTVSRIGTNDGFAIEDAGNMRDVGLTGDASRAESVAVRIGAYLADLGFTSDLAPVADVADNPDATAMRLRSFGADPSLVASMVEAQVRGFASQGILCCAKHFPGIGASVGDSHDGAIQTGKTVDELAADELVPFSAAIGAGVPMVMVGHLSCPQVTGSDVPASLSSEVMRGLLRERLGFHGVVITDSLGMGAVSGRFERGRVCVEAFLAGADALLMPEDLGQAYDAMLEAVRSGEIGEGRLDESVFRIVLMKLSREG